MSGEGKILGYVYYFMSGEGKILGYLYYFMSGEGKILGDLYYLNRPHRKVTSGVPPFPTGILSKSGAGGANWGPFVVYSKVIIIIKL